MIHSRENPAHAALRREGGLTRSNSCPGDLFKERQRAISASALQHNCSLSSVKTTQFSCIPITNPGENEISEVASPLIGSLRTNEVSLLIQSLSTSVSGVHPPYLELTGRGKSTALYETPTVILPALNHFLPNDINGYFSLLKISIRKAVDPNSFYKAWGKALKSPFKEMPREKKNLFLNKFLHEFDTIFQLDRSQISWDERLEYTLSFFREFGDMPDDAYEKVALFILRERSQVSEKEHREFDIYLFDLLETTPFANGIHVILFHLLTAKESIIPKEKLLPLIKKAMKEEIGQGNNDTLWRETTIATQLLSSYVRGAGQEMIWNLFNNEKVKDKWKTLATGLTNQYQSKHLKPAEYFSSLTTSEDFRLPVLMGGWLSAMLTALAKEIEKEENEHLFSLFKYMDELAKEKDLPNLTYQQLFLRIIVPAFKNQASYGIEKDWSFLEASEDFILLLESSLVKMLAQITQKHANDLKVNGEITQGKWLWMNQTLELLENAGLKERILTVINNPLADELLFH